MFDESFDTDRLLPFLQACLADYGFDVQVDLLFGSIGVDTAGQLDAYNAAWEDCQAQAQAAGMARPRRAKTEPELREFYAGLILLRECLINAGYDVESPPTVESFVSSKGMWHPYGSIPNSDVVSVPEDAPAWALEQYEASRKLRETCDPNVSDWVRVARGQQSGNS